MERGVESLTVLVVLVGFARRDEGDDFSYRISYTSSVRSRDRRSGQLVFVWYDVGNFGGILAPIPSVDLQRTVRRYFGLFWFFPHGNNYDIEAAAPERGLRAILWTITVVVVFVVVAVSQ